MAAKVGTKLDHAVFGKLVAKQAVNVVCGGCVFQGWTGSLCPATNETEPLWCKEIIWVKDTTKKKVM